MTGSAFVPTNFMKGVDAATYATPLAQIKEAGALNTSFFDLLVGNCGGTIGETCAIALILGGVYLIVKKVISWRTPVVYIATVLVLTYIFKLSGIEAASARQPIQELFAGGLMLGAFFMATDYASTPVTPRVRLLWVLAVVLLLFYQSIWWLSRRCILLNPSYESCCSTY